MVTILAQGLLCNHQWNEGDAADIWRCGLEEPHLKWSLCQLLASGMVLACGPFPHSHWCILTRGGPFFLLSDACAHHPGHRDGRFFCRAPLQCRHDFKGIFSLRVIKQFVQNLSVYILFYSYFRIFLKTEDSSNLQSSDLLQLSWLWCQRIIFTSRDLSLPFYFIFMYEG